MMDLSLTSFDCRNEFLANGKIWIHAVYTERVIGSVAIESLPDWIWINDLHVEPGFRRRGVGRRLVNEAVLCRGPYLFPQSYGCCAGIRETNVASIALFESLGFEYVYHYPDDPVRLYSRRHRLQEIGSP